MIKIKGQFQNFLCKNPDVVSWLKREGYETTSSQVKFLKKEIKESKYNRMEFWTKFSGIGGGTLIKLTTLGPLIFNIFAGAVSTLLASGALSLVALGTAVRAAYMQHHILAAGSTLLSAACWVYSVRHRNARLLGLVKEEILNPQGANNADELKTTLKNHRRKQRRNRRREGNASDDTPRPLPTKPLQLEDLRIDPAQTYQDKTQEAMDRLRNSNDDAIGFAHGTAEHANERLSAIKKEGEKIARRQEALKKRPQQKP